MIMVIRVISTSVAAEAHDLVRNVGAQLTLHREHRFFKVEEEEPCAGPRPTRSRLMPNSWCLHRLV